MNKKLRALCKSLKKNKPTIVQPVDPEEPEADPLADNPPPQLRKSETKDDGSEVKKSNTDYKISESERRRRLITTIRSETTTNESLTPYEIAMREAKREKEKKLQEEKLKEKREKLEEQNSLRLERNVFNILSIFKSPNGASNNPKILKDFGTTFQYDVDKVMRTKLEFEESVKSESGPNIKDYKLYMKEFKKWIDDNNQVFKKRHYKYMKKEIEGKLEVY